ncbi:MAG: hypothetical protein J6386_13210 [Candidatus Synoicihabitans palmerolidicus]|nr:hypothetical protein [Candidatus Synoicihabitans palmerolidicus]
MVEVADWVADTAGAAVAVALYSKWPGYRNLLEKNLMGRTRLSVAKREGTVPDSR